MKDIREQILAGDVGAAGFGQMEVGGAPCSTPRDYGSGRPRGWPFSKGFSLMIGDAQEKGKLLLCKSLAGIRCSRTASIRCLSYTHLL